MSELLAWLILLPLAWAAIAFLIGPASGGRIAIVALAGQLWMSIRVGIALQTSGPQLHAVGGWGAPLGIDLFADGLAVAMILMIQVVALPVAVYARSYFDASAREARYFWPLTGFLVAGLNALVLSADLFNLYVALELIGLSAVGLVAAGGGAAQVNAALRYLVATLVASGAYLFGVALLYGVYGTVSTATLALLVSKDAPGIAWVAGGLLTVALMVKTALFPFHFWLPPAHGKAPAPVSALLSALVVKASFYLLLRLWIGPLRGLEPGLALASLPALLGGAAILWGSYQAIRAEGLKRLVAYSTVAQLGYLFLIFPLLGRPGAIQAAVMQAVAHALAKAGMFLAAGVLTKATGQDSVAGLSGAAQRLPVSIFAFGLAGMSLMGLPPSSGFLAKWLLISVSLANGYWIIAAMTLIGGLLAAVYVFRVLRQAFVSAPVQLVLHPVSAASEWAALALAAASVVLGLRGVELMRLLEV